MTEDYIVYNLLFHLKVLVILVIYIEFVYKFIRKSIEIRKSSDQTSVSFWDFVDKVLPCSSNMPSSNVFLFTSKASSVCVDW